MMSSRREIYKIPGSGWKSPAWNWGYANGTGHDCAMICRARWDTREKRKALVDMLRNPKEVNGCDSLSVETVDSMRDPPFEEIKLILGLAWQRGRWDGSDGGMGGYGDVLRYMAAAQRYETEDEWANSILLIKDMKERFHLIASDSSLKEMQDLDYENSSDIDGMRRKCAGLVLSEMNFIENGL